MYSRQSSMKICIGRQWVFGAITTLEPLEYNCADHGHEKGHSGMCQVKASLPSSSKPEYWPFHLFVLQAFRAFIHEIYALLHLFLPLPSTKKKKNGLHPWFHIPIAKLRNGVEAADSRRVAVRDETLIR